MSSYDVFICYESTTGADYAENLKKALEKREHSVFLADITIRVGKEWEEEINLALTQCKYFIVLITALTMDSEWVMKEYKKAVDLDKRIIPCRYSRIYKPETKELEKIQQIEFENKSELANKVIIEIKEISKDERKGIKIESDPGEFLKRGILLFDLGKVKEALKSFDRAIEIKPDLAEAWLAKGDALIGLKHYEDALKVLDKAIKIKPDLAIAWLAKGGVFIKSEHYEDALKAFNKAIEIKPNFATAWNLKGSSLIFLGRREDALKAFDKAIEVEPDNATAWFDKGLVLANIDNIEDALKAFNKAIEIKPDFAQALYIRTRIYSFRGDKENALGDLSKAIELDAKYKEEAKKDKAFKNLWDDEDFKKTVS